METTTAMMWLYLLASSSSMSPTADNVTEATVVDKMTTSSDKHSQLYSTFFASGSIARAFTIVLVIIAVVGSVANGYVLLALTLSKNSRKSNVNVFITNQTVMDLAASIFHFIGVMVNLVPKYALQPFVCLIFNTYAISISASHASVCGLVIITIERYVKIVHPVAHRNKYRPWMTRAGIIIPWVFGVCTEFIPTVATTGIVGGQCRRYNLCPTNECSEAWGVIKFLLVYVMPLAILAFAYWKILAVIRRQRKQLGQSQQRAGTSTSQAETAAQRNRRRTEMNVVKTMLLVSLTFVLCFFAMRTYTLLTVVNVVPNVPALWSLFAVLHYSSQCLNPFIYATQYDVVRHWWKAKVCRVVCGQQAQAPSAVGPALPEPVQKRESSKKQHHV